MIKFFRHIRQNLLMENKTGKYFKYAIGEIFLVVIGILIALQINNWNENRKFVNEEKETIASLKLEFEKNLTDLEGSINVIQTIINSCNVLLEFTGPNYEFGSLKNVDSLISMTPRMVVWDPSLYTLSDIKNSGKLSRLSNDDLKILLIEWESFYSNLLDWGDFYVSRGNKYFDYLVENSVNRNLMSTGPLQYSKSKFEGTNEKLLRTPTFESNLINKVAINSYMLNYYSEAKDKLADIIKKCITYEN